MSAMHIYNPTNYYVGQVKRTGARNWQKVGKKSKTLSSAIAKTARHMPGNRMMRVLFCSDFYDPVMVFQGSR